MADPADRLRLVQWLSPAFPIGAFAYSQGLEWAVAAGEVRDAAALEGWVAAVLRYGSGRVDGILLARARESGADLDALADLALALAPGAERAVETMEQGRAFGQALARITGVEQPHLPYPLAVGLATRALDVTTGEVLMLWLQGLAAQLVSAAVRFVPLGQTEGQMVLARLVPDLAALAGGYAGAPLEAISGAAFGADLSAMRHETMEVRIFRS